MKVLVKIQQFLAVITIFIGIMFLFSEANPNSSWVDQAWLTVGGACIIGISALWLWLIGKEEGYFIHEAR